MCSIYRLNELLCCRVCPEMGLVLFSSSCVSAVSEGFAWKLSLSWATPDVLVEASGGEHPSLTQGTKAAGGTKYWTAEHKMNQMLSTVLNQMWKSVHRKMWSHQRIFFNYNIWYMLELKICWILEKILSRPQTKWSICFVSLARKKKISPLI